MANMIDYLAWRGEFGFDITPWNPVDALLTATLSYLGFHGMSDGRGWTIAEAGRADLVQEGNSASFPERKRMFQAMAESARFGGCRMHHYIALTDEEREMQFSATCVDLPDGTMCVAFRGTDNTIVGWREDFNMAYQTLVPAQEAAVYYLAQAAAATDRPLRLCGHSKGGNLAVYAAAGATPEVQARIESIWAFDAPGMNTEMAKAEGYLRVKDRIRAYIPQGSIIGLLMEYFRPYTVVRSTAAGISQHDPMTWQVYGPRFEEMERVDHAAEVMRDTQHDWLENSTPEQRGAFFDVVFRYIESTKATYLSDITSEKLRSLLAVVANRKEVDPESRKAFNRLMAQAVTLGVGNVLERVRNRRDGAGEDKTGGTVQDDGGNGGGQSGTPAGSGGEAPEDTAEERP